MRCVEYYEKCEREGCDWCEKEPETVRVIEEYIKFYKKLESLGIPKATTIVGVSESAARPLIRIQDEQVRERAILSVKNSLESKFKPGKGFIGKSNTLTEKNIKEIIEDVEIELRNKEIEEIVAAENEVEERTGVRNITQEEADMMLGLPPMDPEEHLEPPTNKSGNVIFSEKEVEKIKTEVPKNVVVNTIMQFEIDLYFEIMQKIGCEEDIKKHKKRMSMMMENKTLLVVG